MNNLKKDKNNSNNKDLNQTFSTTSNLNQIY